MPYQTYQGQQQFGQDYGQFQKDLSQQMNQQDGQNFSQMDQQRLRDRIGYFNKNVDNVLVNHPDPRSSHFSDSADRFVRDFAAVEKAQRDQRNKAKQQVIDSRRVQKYERDLKRWEYMEEENERQSAKIANMRSKYQIGNANKGGAAFNIINLDYERSNEGNYLRQRDEAAKVRSMLRSKNIDTLSNAAYNLVSGEDRRRVEVPYHAYYNPPAGSNTSLSRVGAQVFGDGMAGRPLRGMEKPFGKRVASVNGTLAAQYQDGFSQGSPQRTQ